ncbi:DUF6412 domain-containing protein [Cryptosporangium sp. NPDC051539]|uniref:DUF6412 domain-containing protein n=1 Tax=Cryptosporangium sp. NPDC051539 TaxID=3363962 RepID=UPI0037A558D3
MNASRLCAVLAGVTGLLLLVEPRTGGAVLAFVAVAVVGALALRSLRLRLPAPVRAGLVATARQTESGGTPRLRDPDAQGRPRPRAPSPAA